MISGYPAHFLAEKVKPLDSETRNQTKGLKGILRLAEVKETLQTSTSNNLEASNINILKPSSHCVMQNIVNITKTRAATDCS